MTWFAVPLTAALLAASGVLALGVPRAGAVDQSQGYPGFCTSDVGVTVVIDFQELGGETIVRCNPRSTRGTGLDALTGAGIQVDGVQRWGTAFICRIENRPSAVETIPVQGNEDYKERCIDTPPARAYWSYWHAGNNCAWTYSQWGVKNRDFIKGGFEGWSFSLNAGADDNPKPRIAAVRPGTAGGSCNATAEPKPTSNDPGEQKPPSAPRTTKPTAKPSSKVGSTTAGAPAARRPSASASASSSPSTSSTPTGTASPTATTTPDDPANNVAFTGGENAPRVQDVVKEQAGASDLAPWIAAAVIALLAALAIVTSRRRRRVREDL